MGSKKLILVYICISVQDCGPVVFGSLPCPAKFTFLKAAHLTENELISSSESSQVICENYRPRLSFLFSWFLLKMLWAFFVWFFYGNNSGFLSAQLLVPCPTSYLTYWLILIRLNRWVKDFEKISFHKLCVNWWPSKEEIRAVCIFILLVKSRREKWWKGKEYWAGNCGIRHQQSEKRRGFALQWLTARLKKGFWLGGQESWFDTPLMSCWCCFSTFLVPNENQLFIQSF